MNYREAGKFLALIVKIQFILINLNRKGDIEPNNDYIILVYLLKIYFAMSKK